MASCLFNMLGSTSFLTDGRQILLNLNEERNLLTLNVYFGRAVDDDIFIRE